MHMDRYNPVFHAVDTCCGDDVRRAYPCFAADEPFVQAVCEAACAALCHMASVRDGLEAPDCWLAGWEPPPKHLPWVRGINVDVPGPAADRRVLVICELSPCDWVAPGEPCTVHTHHQEVHHVCATDHVQVPAEGSAP